MQVSHSHEDLCYRRRELGHLFAAVEYRVGEKVSKLLTTGSHDQILNLIRRMDAEGKRPKGATILNRRLASLQGIHD